jgi:hypothetical protein
LDKWGDFYRDPDGTLAWGACSYIKKMLTNYEIMFGCKPKEYSSPMAEKDHPELDYSEEPDKEGIKQYQSLIGALQCFPDKCFHFGCDRLIVNP